MSLSQSGAPKRHFTQVGSNLTRKHQTRLEKLVRYKHSSLLQIFGNYKEKRFITLAPVARRLYRKTFYGLNLFWTVVSQNVLSISVTSQYSNIFWQSKQPRVFSSKGTKLGWSLGIKYQTGEQVADSNEHSSLLRYGIYYGRKKICDRVLKENVGEKVKVFLYSQNFIFFITYEWSQISQRATFYQVGKDCQGQILQLIGSFLYVWKKILCCEYGGIRNTSFSS